MSGGLGGLFGGGSDSSSGGDPSALLNQAGTVSGIGQSLYNRGNSMAEQSKLAGDLISNGTAATGWGNSIMSKWQDNNTGTNEAAQLYGMAQPALANGGALNASQQGAIDSLYNQQLGSSNAQLQQQAANSGMGVNSALTQQSQNNNINNLQTARLSQENQAHQTNLTQANSMLGASLTALGLGQQQQQAVLGSGQYLNNFGTNLMQLGLQEQGVVNQQYQADIAHALSAYGLSSQDLASVFGGQNQLAVAQNAASSKDAAGFASGLGSLLGGSGGSSIGGFLSGLF